MMRGRIAVLFAVLSVSCASTVLAQEECSPEQVLASSRADTIFVEHVNALENCCLDLRIAVEVEAFVVDFYESDVGQPCDCLCCFLLRYEAHGFQAGHYIVRVWNEDGSVLHGETEVDVEGAGTTPVVGLVDQGDCLEPGAVEEPTEVPTTWGRVRASYR